MIDNLVGSPVIDPTCNLDEMLVACASVGIHKFEIMTGWTGSAFDIDHGAPFYLDIAQKHTIQYTYPRRRLTHCQTW